jgi:hypothetical protein
VRVLNRNFTFALPFRFSNFESQPPVHTKIHGTMASEAGEQAVTGLSDNNIGLMNQHARVAAYGYHSQRHPKPIHIHSLQLHSEVGGSPTPVLFTSDADGNVVAYADTPQARRGPTYPLHTFEQMEEWGHTDPAYRQSALHNQGTRGQAQEYERRERELAASHKRHVAEGRVYARMHVHPDVKHHLLSHAQAFRERTPVPGLEDYGRTEHDEAPQGILADMLEENGYPLAHLLRMHPQMHPEMLHHVLENTDESKIDDVVLDIIQKEGRPHERHSLKPTIFSFRFAHLTGFRPRRFEYHPKPRATDLRETEWGKIHHYFPEPEMGPKNRRTPVKVLINAVLFRLENQLPLRQLEQVAPDFPPWGSVHSFEYRVAEAGLWPTLLTEIGRAQLVPIAEKLIHGVKKAGAPETNARVNVEGLPVA